MKNNQLTLTIGIPAYNEARVIGRLLNSLTQQVFRSTKLLEVIVEIDGSSDHTYDVVADFKNSLPGLKIVRGSVRKGKISRLNHLHKIFKGDILITLDADVYLKNHLSIFNLLKPIISGKTKFAYGSKIFDTMDCTYFSRGVVEREKIWSSMRNTLNYGNNIYNCSGSYSAFSASFAKQLQYPEHISSDNQYSYLFALSHGTKPIYVKDAIVLSQPTRNFGDFIKQNIRLRDEQDPISQIFGSKYDTEYRLPVFNKYGALLKEFSSHPVLAVYAIILDLLIKIYPGTHRHIIWDIATSTKELI